MEQIDKQEIQALQEFNKHIRKRVEGLVRTIHARASEMEDSAEVLEDTQYFKDVMDVLPELADIIQSISTTVMMSKIWEDDAVKFAVD